MSKQRVTVEDVPSLAYRGVEATWFGPMVLGALFVLLIVVTASSILLQGSGAGAISSVLAGTSVILYLVYFLVGLVSYLAAPVALYLDAKKVSEADASWDPTPWLYALLSFFLHGLVIIDYLYRRHEYVVDREERSWWWVVPAVALLAALLSVVCSLAGTFAGVDVIGKVGLLSYAFGLPVAFLVPVALYKDAIHVRLHCGWHPNPALHSMIALPLAFLYPLFFPLHLGYYLFRRSRNLGLSL